MFITSILAVAFAATLPHVLAQAADASQFLGTWCSGAKKVATGPGFANPVQMGFTPPNVTGVSYAFDPASNNYETARYRYVSNGSYPNCITGVLLWHHGKYSFNPNGSITLTPLPDGYQQVQNACAAVSNFIQSYNDIELLSTYQFVTDKDGTKLLLFQADGTPIAPLSQLYSTANMLPTQLLRNVSGATIDSQSLFATNGGSPRWSSAGVTSAVLILGVTSLSLLLL